MRYQLRRREFLVSAAALVYRPDVSARIFDVGAAAAAKRGRVVAACTKHWPDNKGDCSGFVRAVVTDLKVGTTLSGQANDICEQIAAKPWVRIGVGKDASVIAGVSAGEGKLVVAGLAAPQNGHVAIVVDYRNAFDSYQPVDRDKAVGFWGKLRSVGKEYTRLTVAWTEEDLKKVTYAYVEIPG